MNQSRQTFIHLGLPKTATTALQTHLFANHSQIHYLGKFPRELPHFENRQHLQSIYHHFFNGEFSEPSDSRLADQLVYAANHNLTPTLSKEGIAGAHRERKAELARYFTDCFGACKAILCVREPSSFIKSLYTQKLKSFQKDRRNAPPPWLYSIGKPPKYFEINEWLNAVWNSEDSPRLPLSYADTAEIFGEVFGRNNVHIFIFEELVQNPKGFISKLCNTMGIDAEEGFRLIDGKRANDGITDNFVAQLKKIERSRIRTLQYRRASRKKKREILNPANFPGEKITPEIPDEWLKKIHAFGTEQNRRLVTDWGVPLTDYGYRI